MTSWIFSRLHYFKTLKDGMLELYERYEKDSKRTKELEETVERLQRRTSKLRDRLNAIEDNHANGNKQKDTKDT